MSTKTTFSIEEISAVEGFVQQLEAASQEWGIRVDSLDGIYLVVDGKDSCLFVHSDDDKPYVVSALVPL